MSGRIVRSPLYKKGIASWPQETTPRIAVGKRTCLRASGGSARKSKTSGEPPTRNRCASCSVASWPSCQTTADRNQRAATRRRGVLIRRYRELSQLPNGAKVIERLEEWKWPWAGRSAADKQRFLEPLLLAAQRDPLTNEDIVIFLLIVFEPIRRSVSSAFRRAASGLTAGGPDPVGLLRRTARPARWCSASDMTRAWSRVSCSPSGLPPASTSPSGAAT